MDITKTGTTLIRFAGRTVLRGLLGLVIMMVILTLIHFPYDTDPNPDEDVTTSADEESAGFYEAAYLPKDRKAGLDYEATAKEAAETGKVEERLREFVEKYDLSDKRSLEVGSGRGYLQDVVSDYTGLDISPSVAHHYHKPFVVGSATDMPFSDNSFDVVWTVWVLEHIPQPEKVFQEIRRVLKPDGVLWLVVAWNCTPWAADGFEVRPYSDFNWRGKAVKATLPLRSSPWFRAAYGFPTRALRMAQYEMFEESTRLRFRALDPNYDIYWQPDSDAAISLDSFETYLWFRSRGDVCLNCGSAKDEFLSIHNPLIIQVHKPKAEHVVKSAG